MFCSYDYLMITNKDNKEFGRYSGNKTGEVVVVTGDVATIHVSFHSNAHVENTGFLIRFITVPLGKHQ